VTKPVLHLLDANALIALTNASHIHHGRVADWFDTIDRWATTPITEAAFVRLMLNPLVAGAQLTRANVVEALAAIRDADRHEFLPDQSSLADPRIDLSGLLSFRQVADMHLVNLAAGHGAVLATLDKRIRAALKASEQRWVHLI
jgi:toxin-antitoxin system PIN domain toxin